MTKREKELTKALRNMVALFHAMNANYISWGIPCKFAAVQNANVVLTGDPLESGFAITPACRAISATNGSELVLD